MSQLKVVLLIIIFTGILTISGCASKPKEVMELKVGLMSIVDCLTFFVADEKEGLHVKPVTMSGGVVIIPSVESGELDIGFSNVLSVAVAHSKGSDLKFITPGAFKDGEKGNVFKLIVHRESAINTPKNVEGKKIAINTFNNIMDLNLKVWADKEGVDYSKINVIEVPFPQMESALETREIDGVIMVEPYPSILKQHDWVSVLDDKPLNAIGESFMIGGWFAKESWIRNNPDKLTAFNNAMLKANKYLINNPEEIPGILSKYTRVDEDVAREMVLPVFKEELETEDLWTVIKASLKYGYIPEEFDAKEIMYTPG